MESLKGDLDLSRSHRGPKKAPGADVPSTSWIALVKKEVRGPWAGETAKNEVGGPSMGEGKAELPAEGGASMIRVKVAVSMMAELRSGEDIAEIIDSLLMGLGGSCLSRRVAWVVS